MIYLIGSIVLSSYLILAFKFGERHGIDRLQTIIFNYITCLAVGFLLHPCLLCSVNDIFNSTWWPFAGALGVLFFISFNLMAYTTKHAGIMAVSLASKLSMIIPISLAFVFYKDHITFYKIAGIAIALLSVFILSYQKQHGLQRKGIITFVVWLVFIMSGINDSLVKWVQLHGLYDPDFILFNTSVFMFAAIVGVLSLLFSWLIKNKEIKPKNVIYGIAIGIPNYFSLLCLILAIHQSGWESSFVFPINNVGIILFSAGVGVIFMKEQITKAKLTGILLAITSIFLMTWGK